MLDVALVALIRDMSEKAGVDGTIQYWTRVGENLAKRIGKEAYMGWPSFNVAFREGRTGFSIEGEATPLTDLAITDVDGDVVGYIYAMRQCCFVPTILRVRYSVGELPRADRAVAEEYNNTVHDIAVCNFCVIHEKFREEVAKNITIDGQPLDCLLLATRGYTGETKISEKNLVKIGMNPDQVRALLRNYECVYAILMKGAKLKEEKK
ncbi:MAG TPA: hypothetical protein VJ397_04085 [Thermoplasmata archaeon]|nr:hypothetical protein [Thermoplasmata archaeon]